MGAWDFNPQISDQAPSFLASGLSSLGAGIGAAIQKQQVESAAAKKEAEALQFESVKNQALAKTLFEKKFMSPEQYLEFQSAPPKKQKAIAEGAVANATFRMMLDKSAAANAPMSVTSVPVPGGQPLNVLGGGGMTPRPLPPPAPPLGVQSVPVPGGGSINVAGGGGMTPQVLPQPKPTPGPLGVTRVPRPGGGTVDVIGGAGMNPTILKPDDQAKPPLIERIPPTLFDEASKNGYFVVPQTDGSVQWLKKKDFDPATNSAVKTFDDTIGKTYGIKSADIFKINLTEPESIKYVDPTGTPGTETSPGDRDKQISTEEAIALGPKAIAVVPISDPTTTTKTRRIPLPEWNTIVNQWKALPRAGEAPVAPPTSSAGPSGGRTLSAKDQEALEWALAAPPNDPDAIRIKARLGIK